ncbi:MAG: RusA family crossover junction endodeoxyribonuclease [Thermoguttaceae bacterium]|nr:RusA family crossover junction endodeoxyribonuclease [Thermoguttaceae bacterium]
MEARDFNSEAQRAERLPETGQGNTGRRAIAAWRCRLPWPPSANLIWRTSRNVTYLSKTYKDFLRSAAGAILCQKPRDLFITEPIRVEIVLHPPRNFHFDIDNRVKPLLDILTRACVWKDDSLVHELTVRRGEIKKNGLAVVYIRAIDKSKEKTENA